MKEYLELSDGTCIEAYLKSDRPESITPDKFNIDTTDEFLQMGTKPHRHKRIVTCTNEEELNLFLKHAHSLMAHGDAIMADSRMFLAPVPVRNGLAYTGTSGLRNPTLGVYIDWWRNYECAWAEDKYGERQPIYYIAGSPLSGSNTCAYIGPEGNGCTVSVYPFSPVWGSFMEVNNHYTEAKQLYEAYSLEAVIEILFGDQRDSEMRLPQKRR
jgi:hypothetical protein